MAGEGTAEAFEIPPGGPRFWASIMDQLRNQGKDIGEIKGALLGQMGRSGLIHEHEQLKKRVDALERGKVHGNGLDLKRKSITIAFHIGSGAAGAAALKVAELMFSHIK